MKRQDKIEYGVGHNGKALKEIKEDTVPLCTICKRNFLFLQDDFKEGYLSALDEAVSRCMECYGQHFGLDHLLLYLKEMGNRLYEGTPIPLKYLWEYPVDNPTVIDQFANLGIDITKLKCREE